jgi:hypothetical protein
VADIERKHETKIPYIIETKNGAENGVIDLEALSYEELVARVVTLPAAMDELMYRQAVNDSKNTKQ